MGKMLTMIYFLVKFHTLSVVFCPFAIQTPSNKNPVSPGIPNDHLYSLEYSQFLIVQKIIYLTPL